ncbi:SMC-Scp complex subunit ScpB [Terriglobus roseus]|uniref:Condensin subunit ScpB n=1 Tax=Terriglobus roseus TaxID=392734 RepID=A0A1H4RU64_9BACT|nr:SMC-Scp complex subunit ScpB [Terriglobus roseus]SEC35399.1 condensin subunit ScpB [Terriglobus roseus]
MSLKSKIEAVIYASEEPVTLPQLVGLLAGEAQAELDEIAANQSTLPLDGEPEQTGKDEQQTGRSVLEAGTRESNEADSSEEQAVDQGEVAGATPDGAPVEPEAVAELDNSEATAEPSELADEGLESVEPKPDTEAEKRLQRDRDRAVRDHIRRVCDSLIREYAESDRGIEIREVASGFRMGTKPEYHDAVRGFVKSLKPALKLTLPALETLAVVAYKQPVTAAEISEIRGVDSAGVLGGLMTRKLIATAGRKQVIGRPMLYKTTRDFLLRFGLKDVNELPSMEEFERMAGELAEQEDLPMDGSADGIIEEANARGDAEMIRDVNEPAAESEETPSTAETPVETTTNDNEEATAESAAGGNDEEQGIEGQAAVRATDEAGEDSGSEEDHIEGVEEVKA